MWMPSNWPRPPKNDLPRREFRCRWVGLDAKGYRPWRATLNVDLYRRKPEEGCAAPTHSTASKTLFDPKMGKTGKVKHKASKKH